MSARIRIRENIPGKILDSILGGVILLDAEGRVEIWNNWMVEHSGVLVDFAIGKRLDTLLEEEIAPALQAAINSALSYGSATMLSNSLHRFPLPLYNRSLSGVKIRRVEQSIRVTPTHTEDNEILCLIQITDVTTSVEREESLRLKNIALQEAQQQTILKSIELEEAKESAEQATL
ncbi:MAG: hypothetical protein OEL79_08250, partial [Chromatiales bacterium]|nr:hypothetical protein [Chromatiales bacterium]